MPRSPNHAFYVMLFSVKISCTFWEIIRPFLATNKMTFVFLALQPCGCIFTAR